MRNPVDVTGKSITVCSQSTSVVSAVNPLVAFYAPIRHPWNKVWGAILMFCLGLHTSYTFKRDISSMHPTVRRGGGEEAATCSRRVPCRSRVITTSQYNFSERTINRHGCARRPLMYRVNHSPATIHLEHPILTLTTTVIKNCVTQRYRGHSTPRNGDVQGYGTWY
jgi:hypothetical protein